MAITYSNVYDGPNFKVWDVFATLDADSVSTCTYVNQDATNFPEATPDTDEYFMFLTPVFMAPDGDPARLSLWVQNGNPTRTFCSIQKATTMGSGSIGRQLRLAVVRVPAPTFG